MSNENTESRDTGQLGRDLPAAEPTANPRFSLRSLFIATLVVCVLLAIAVPVIRAAQRATVRTHCANNLAQIALALHNYHDVNKVFPCAIRYTADGRPMHSWRIAVLPYLIQQGLYDQYDFREPWNGPRNGQFIDEIPDPGTRGGANSGKVLHLADAAWVGLRCPSAPRSQNRMCTNYVMLIDDRPGKPNGPPNRPGSVPPSCDDKSAVIIIEIADSDIHWMEPRDVLLSEMSMKINDRSKRSLSSYHGGACIARADGKIEILDEATTEEQVRELLKL